MPAKKKRKFGHPIRSEAFPTTSMKFFEVNLATAGRTGVATAEEGHFEK